MACLRPGGLGVVCVLLLSAASAARADEIPSGPRDPADVEAEIGPERAAGPADETSPTTGPTLGAMLASPTLDHGAVVEPAVHTSDAERAGPQERDEEWYGHQTLIVDSVAVGLLIAGIAFEQPYLFVPSALVGALGSPTVHFANRETGLGFLSLGMRTLGPGLGLLVATRNLGAGLILLGLGMLVPVGVDAALAWKPTRRRATSWYPQVVATRSGAIAVLSGSL